MFVVHLLIFLAGLSLVLASLQSAIRTLIVPRSTADQISSLVFRSMRRVFDIRLKRVKSYEERDRVMAFFGPVSVLLLLPAWLILILFGYMAMYWALGVEPWNAAFTLSGSSLLTLGFAPVICDTHAEEDEWEELRAALQLKIDGSIGYGISSGACLKVWPDGRTEAIGGDTARYIKRCNKVVKVDDLFPK